MQGPSLVPLVVLYQNSCLVGECPRVEKAAHLKVYFLLQNPCSLFCFMLAVGVVQVHEFSVCLFQRSGAC